MKMKPKQITYFVLILLMLWKFALLRFHHVSHEPRQHWLSFYFSHLLLWSLVKKLQVPVFIWEQNPMYVSVTEKHPTRALSEQMHEYF